MTLKARNTLRKIDVICMKEHKEPLGIYTFDISFSSQDHMIIPEEHECGDLIKLADYETINIESFKNKGVDYMFTLDSDIVGLQQHIQEFSPIFRIAFKCYVAGNWEEAAENIERCLELWETDGPTKALKYYLSFYRFQAPGQWNGYRDIDVEIDQDKINMEQNFQVDEVEDQLEGEGIIDGEKDDKDSGGGSKSKSNVSLKKSSTGNKDINKNSA